jgi:hypothetical protein
MLSKLVSLFGVSAVFADLMNNDVDTRYFITQFNLAEFPMSIDTCNPTDVLGQGGYQMASCVDESNLEWSFYTDSSCASSTGLVIAINASSQTGYGTYTDFNCNPAYTDAIASVEFSVGTCDTTTKVTMDAAVGVCALNTGVFTDPGSEWTRLRVYCDADMAELQYFEAAYGYTSMCDEDTVYKIRNATTTCGYMLTTSGIDVYGTLLGCDVSTESTTDEMTTSTEEPDSGDSDGDSSSASALSMVGLLFASIFAALSM